MAPGAQRPSAILTFLAPAPRCNQRCPDCILDQVGEPVTQFELTPRDFARFVEQFIAAQVPIHSVVFQGYEVTLPRSWPYLEAVFQIAQQHGIRRAFVTNGMLLSKWTARIKALDPYRIAVSLDGASPETNDPRRGLPGAFTTTLRSLRAFLRDAPILRNRVVVLSCVYGEDEFQSLLEMPRLLRQMGIGRWSLSGPLALTNGIATMTQSRATLVRWFAALKNASETENIAFHVSDEFGFFKGNERSIVGAGSVRDIEHLYRVDPLGTVRVGREILNQWNDRDARRWNPTTDNAVEVCGYGTSETTPP